MTAFVVLFVTVLKSPRLGNFVKKRSLFSSQF
jgi:hypothetical protein